MKNISINDLFKYLESEITYIKNFNSDIFSGENLTNEELFLMVIIYLKTIEEIYSNSKKMKDIINKYDLSEFYKEVMDLKLDEEEYSL